jgi:hypothetical protein
MSKRPPTRRLRVTFEPNRFSSEQLSKVYEQLKPTESRELPTLTSDKRKTQRQQLHIKRGEQ